MCAQPACSSSDECRCHCGSLLARIVDGAVELKCRRCKRTHRVPIEAGYTPLSDDHDLPMRRTAS